MDCTARDMDFSAARMTFLREITPHAPVASLVCGEFRQTRGYTNWRPRGTDDWLLITTLAGAGRIIAHGRELCVSEGMTVLYRPRTPHDYSTEPRAGVWALRWAHFVAKPHWQPWLMWPEFERGVGCVTLEKDVGLRVEASFARMLLAARLGGTAAVDLAMNALEEALIWTHRAVAGDGLLRVDPRIQRATAFLASHPGEPFSLGAVARHSGLSLSRLSHLFKTEMGVTPRQFSEKLRLDLAAQLLVQTGLGVRHVAAQTGFADPFYFSRRFRQVMGAAPMAFRQRGLAKASNE